MRTRIFALAFATLLACSAQAFADDISDCNSDKPDSIIKGCSQIIDAGKASTDAMAVAYFNRALAYDDGGDHDSAIADYTQSIKLKPDYADSYFNRGLSYKDKKDFDSAIADFSKAVKLNPDFAKAYFARGNVLEAKGELKEALADFQHAGRLVPGNKVVQEKIAGIQQKLGQ